MHRTHLTTHQKDCFDNDIAAQYSSEYDKCDYVQSEEVIKVDESDLVVLQLNIRGLSSKIAQFKSLLENLTDGKKPDIILLSETWLNESSPKFSLPGYDSYNIHRIHKKGGGVSILISSTIKSQSVRA